LQAGTLSSTPVYCLKVGYLANRGPYPSPADFFSKKHFSRGQARFVSHLKKMSERGETSARAQRLSTGLNQVQIVRFAAIRERMNGTLANRGVTTLLRHNNSDVREWMGRES
jgi:hypothetical protein